MSDRAETELNEGNQTFNEDIEESHESNEHTAEIPQDQGNESTPAPEEEQEQGEQEQEQEEQAEETVKKEEEVVKKGRGRPMKQGVKRKGLLLNISDEPDLRMKYNLDEIPIDANGNIIDLQNDEYVLTPDPEGNNKINEYGELRDGREYRVATFTLPNRNQGRTLYVLGNDMARLLKYKDAYVFFLNYKTTLYKAFLTDDEREYLLSIGILKQGVKSRTISITTVRSCFREFGHKIIKQGQPKLDDYYTTTEAYPVPTQAISAQEVARRFLSNTRSVLSGTGAVTNTTHTGLAGSKMFSPSATPALASSVGATQRSTPIPNFYVNNNAKRTVEFFNMMNSNMNISLNDKMNKENWIHMHAQSCLRYNEDLFYEREKIQFIDNSGIRDPYTNTLHVPLFTQPTKILGRVLKPVSAKDKTDKLKKSKILYETRIKDDNLRNVKTGLSDLPLHLFKDMVSDDVKEAMDAQVEYESNN